jgi:competence protein ComEA
MPLLVPSGIVLRPAFILALAASALTGQELPEGPGREEVIRLCSQCHELARSLSLRQDRDGWTTTISKMTAYGMKASPEQLQVIVEYLAKHYPAEEVPRININTARQIELEAGLSLRRSEAAAVIAWREKHGPIKSLEELKRVPGIDAAKIEAKKHRITFN